MFIKKIVPCLVITLLYSTQGYGNKLMIEQFISPETCGGCHSQIYDQWQNSMHNLAHNDPVYLAVSQFFMSGLSDKEEIAEAESCVKCHTPVGYITGYPTKSSDDRTKIAEIATHGIQCDYCHSATGADKMYNNGLIINPGNGEDDPGVKLGPRKDAESDFHETKFSKFHTDSNICGTCHNVKHVSFGTDLETTFDEWEQSPYNSEDPEKRVTCQGCHMYQRIGIPATGSTDRPDNKGTAVDDGPVRDHVFTHNFVGGNGFIPGRSGSDDKMKMAEDRLKNAATLLIDDSKVKEGKLNITITNSGAGHKLPTGLTDFRQMWLEITVVDGKGVELFSSGKLDENGYVPENSIIFNTVYGDGKGNPVLNIAKAREILKDRRILPMQSLTEEINFVEKNTKIFEKKLEEINVHARLLYRSGSKKVLDQVAGKNKFIMPVVTMAEADKTIKL
ncbi:MAG: cytochrome c554 family protein [Desulfamplus sp.]|nr:cytochrome c554 family protein [Desulfamplus sp.]